MLESMENYDGLKTLSIGDHIRALNLGMMNCFAFSAHFQPSFSWIYRRNLCQYAAVKSFLSMNLHSNDVSMVTMLPLVQTSFSLNARNRGSVLARLCLCFPFDEV